MVRGLDGPGMSPLDVFPRPWRHVPGLPRELEHRQRKLARLQVCSRSITIRNRCEQMSICFPGLHHAGPHHVAPRAWCIVLFVSCQTGSPVYDNRRSPLASSAVRAVSQSMYYGTLQMAWVLCIPTG